MQLIISGAKPMLCPATHFIQLNALCRSRIYSNSVHQHCFYLCSGHRVQIQNCPFIKTAKTPKAQQHLTITYEIRAVHNYTTRLQVSFSKFVVCALCALKPESRVLITGLCLKTKQQQQTRASNE